MESDRVSTDLEKSGNFLKFDQIFFSKQYKKNIDVWAKSKLCCWSDIGQGIPEFRQGKFGEFFGGDRVDTLSY